MDPKKLINALDRREERRTTNVHIRQFKVVSAQTGPPLSLTLDDRGTNIIGVRYLSSYTSPAANHIVWALIDSDADIIVLGRLA